MNSRGLRRLGLGLSVLLAVSGADAVQLTFSSNATDHGVGLGWAGNTGYIAGERGGLPTLFTFANGAFTATNLSGMDTAWRISADGRTIMGVNGAQGVLTSLGNLGTYTLIPFLLGDNASEPHGSTVGVDPLVVGFTGGGSFTWTAASGIQNFQHPVGQGDVALTGVSADGAVFVGSSRGAGPSDNAFLFQNGSFTFLNELGGNHSWALCVSPNGKYYGGYIDGQATLWGGPTDLRLTRNGSPLLGGVECVTDNGFAFGSTGSDGWVYDPRTGVASLLDDWLATENGAPVGHHITGVFGAIWDGVELHLGLKGSMGIATVALTRLTITQPGPGEIELRWPTNRSGTVEYTLQLPPVNWTPLTNVVPVLTNNQFTLTLPITNTAAFFRLYCP